IGVLALSCHALFTPNLSKRIENSNHRIMDSPAWLAHLSMTVAQKEIVMSATSATRRDLIAISAAGAVSLLTTPSVLAAGSNAMPPFRISIREDELIDLRRRIAATRWPDRETVNDRSQGVQLARLQALVRYWGTDYDWRKAEAKLNALPQFMITIDDVDIHF